MEKGQSAWVEYPKGWHKLNTGGDRKEFDGSVSCGGVIRDSSDNSVMGFSKFIRVMGNEYMLHVCRTRNKVADELATSASSEDLEVKLDFNV
ncbi:hypothetical protein V6N13_087304 [Hibiscus sabdariffa]